MSDIYQITLKQEVLREIAASLGARYWRYISKYVFDCEDRENPIIAYKWEIYAMSDSILMCETLDELKVFSDRLKELRSIIERLEEECKKKGWLGILKTSLLKRSKKYLKHSRQASSL
jgi:hypothetical protein